MFGFVKSIVSKVTSVIPGPLKIPLMVAGGIFGLSEFTKAKKQPEGAPVLDPAQLTGMSGTAIGQLGAQGAIDAQAQAMSSQVSAGQYGAPISG